MKELVLFSSKACCLCDEAMSLIERSALKQSLSIKKVDIYTDKQLLIRYRTTIPVVRDVQSESEIGWPFDIDSFDSWLRSL